MVVHEWAKMINGMCGINPKHVCQLHSSKSGYDSDLQKLSSHQKSIVRDIVETLRHEGLRKLDSKTLKPHKWPLSNGQKIGIHRIKRNKIRIIFSHIIDEPESSSKIPVIYLHNVFIKKGDKQYKRYLKRISKTSSLDYHLEENSEPIPDVVKNEIWKTKDSFPYVPTSDDEYEELKNLAKNSDMAVFPTMDQINAISQPKRPLFINGQAGTGKTTGLSWLLSLRIPFDLMEKNGNRILVTAMTETVVEKLKNNTRRLFNIRHNYLENMFKLDEGEIIQHIEKSLNSKSKWHVEGGADIVFLNFKQILLDIASLSKEKIAIKLEYYESLIEKKHRCSINFDINDETSVKNRNRTCKFCLEDPRFHIDWSNLEKSNPNEAKIEMSKYRRLRKIKELIENYSFGSNVTYSNFLIEFFSTRSFDIEPEFAWYGIRTIIKGYSVNNNYNYLNKSDFQNNEIVKSTISEDFHGKLNQLFDCYDKYRSWLRYTNKRDDMDLVTDVAFLLDILKSDDSNLIEYNFDNILLDEAQDLTNVEYEVLLNLLKSDKKSEVVFAGDPLQTINPTGFDWNRMKDLMYGVGNNQDGLADPQILNHNWRTPRSIVEISNGILGLREKVILNEKVQQQEAHELGSKPVLIYLCNKYRERIVDPNLLERFLTTKSAYKVTVRESDKRGLENLIDNDGLLDPEVMKTNHNMHTVTEIKGDEAASVVLYRTGEMDAEDLNKLLANKDEIEAMDNGTRIRLKFIINQLYILTTRSNEKMYIIESDRHKGRIWETLFADFIDVDEVPDDVLENILAIADEDFILYDWANEQLKLWTETKELKFLTWAIEEFEKEMKKRTPKTAEDTLYNRIKAIDYEEKADFAKAGEHWKKAGEHKLSFDCFIAAKDWSKAKESKFKGSKDYFLILDFLENDKNIDNEQKFKQLFDLVKETFSLKDDNFPDWLKPFKNDLTQFLFDKIIMSKSYGDYVIPLEEFDKMDWSSCDKEGLEVTLDDLYDLARESSLDSGVEILRNFISDIKTRFPNVSTEKQEVFVLDHDLSETSDFTPEQNKVLVKMILVQGLNSNKSNIYKSKLICNTLEFTNFDSKVVSDAFKSELKKYWFDNEAFLKNLSTTTVNQMELFRDILILINCKIDTSVIDTSKLVSSLISTYNSDFLSKSYTKNKHKAEFGQNARNYFQSDNFSDLAYKRISNLLISIDSRQLNKNSSIGKLFLEFNWKNDSWAYHVGEIFVELEKNVRNRNLIDKFTDWLKEKLSFENYHEDSQLMKILQLMIDSEDDSWILESLAEELDNERLSQRLQMEKISRDPESNDDNLRMALAWFRNNGFSAQEKRILTMLPDTIEKEIENSNDLDVGKFAQLIEVVLSSKSSISAKKLMGSKISTYSKRFRLHNLLDINLIEDSLEFVEGDIKQFWNLLLGERYLMFTEYAYENIPTRVASALYKMMPEVHGKLSQIKGKGSKYTFLASRWEDYKDEDEYDKIFSESALCSILNVVYQENMTAEEIRDFSVKINGDSIKVEKKSEMVKSILESYNKKISTKSSQDFIDTIVKPI